MFRGSLYGAKDETLQFYINGIRQGQFVYVPNVNNVNVKDCFSPAAIDEKKLHKKLRLFEERGFMDILPTSDSRIDAIVLETTNYKDVAKVEKQIKTAMKYIGTDDILGAEHTLLSLPKQ